MCDQQRCRIVVFIVWLGATTAEWQTFDIDSVVESLQRVETAFKERKAQSSGWPQRWIALRDENAAPSSALEDGAILLAEWGDQADSKATRDILDNLADRVRHRLPSSWSLGGDDASGAHWSPRAAAAIQDGIAALNAELFEAYGLAGNAENYYDPANTFISAVLRRRLGIPISLSIIWESVARRIGLKSYVLARFPGHVLIRVPVVGSKDASSDIYVDSFVGSVMKWNDVVEFAAKRGLPSSAEEIARYVAPCPHSEVHSRMLLNLIGIYSEQNQGIRLLGILDQAIALGPTGSLERLKSYRKLVANELEKNNAL